MNRNKLIPFALGIIAIVIASLVVLIQYNNKQSKVLPYPTQIPTAKTDTTTTQKTIPIKSNEYTMAQVSIHKTPSDCWTTINGGVYNVTPWINQHPGGAERIISLCGIDGSSAFDGQHGGQARPASELASFKIGTLK